MTAEINVVPYIDVMLVCWLFYGDLTIRPECWCWIAKGLLQRLSQLKIFSCGWQDASFIIVEVNKDGELGLSVNDEEVQRGLSIEDIIVRVKANCLLNRSPVAVLWRRANIYADCLLLDELSRAGVPKLAFLTDIKE